MLRKPQDAVACSGVQPSLSPRLTSAPRSTRNSTMSKLSSMHAWDNWLFFERNFAWSLNINSGKCKHWQKIHWLIGVNLDHYHWSLIEFDWYLKDPKVRLEQSISIWMKYSIANIDCQVPLDDQGSKKSFLSYLMQSGQSIDVGCVDVSSTLDQFFNLIFIRGCTSG